MHCYEVLTMARELNYQNYHKYFFVFVFTQEAFGSVKQAIFCPRIQREYRIS